MTAFKQLTLSLLCFSSALAADKPNIVIILTDDMGYGDPTCFNPDSKIPRASKKELVRTKTSVSGTLITR